MSTSSGAERKTSFGGAGAGAPEMRRATVSTAAFAPLTAFSAEPATFAAASPAAF